MAAKVSIEDAAQLSVEELTARGRFNLRGLAEGLGIMSDEERKSAFMSGTNEEMAKMIRAALDERAGGGKGAKKGSVTRQPSNKKSAAAATAAVDDEDEAPSTPSGKKGGTDDLSKILAAIQANTKTLNSVLAQLKSVAAISSGTNRFSVVQFGLLAQLAEQSLQADTDSILEEIGSRMEEYEGHLANLAGAKTEDEEEDEEGNE